MSSGDNFKLPNLKGRFVLGANVNNTESGSEYEGEAGEAITTHNLPSGLYSGDDFTSGGQFKMPTEVGKEGGDPTTTQDTVSQMAQHTHTTTGIQEHNATTMQSVSNNGSGAYAFNSNLSVSIASNSSGVNAPNIAVYPPNAYPSADTNIGMLSMPPYVTFAWIMRIKK